MGAAPDAVPSSAALMRGITAEIDALRLAGANDRRASVRERGQENTHGMKDNTEKMSALRRYAEPRSPDSDV